MSTVPGNALQDKFSRMNQQARRPAYGMLSVVPGVLIKVYDRDTLQGAVVPGELSRAIQKRPEGLYGQVKLESGKLLYLPFKESAELIYAIYGDSKLIEGRKINVLCYDRNVHLGEIVLVADTQSLQDTSTTTNVFDIGGIF